MGKFVAYYYEGNGTEKKKIGSFNERNNAVIACADYNNEYCLDKREDRIEGLMSRDFYIIGCGPRQFSIEEE